MHTQFNVIKLKFYVPPEITWIWWYSNKLLEPYLFLKAIVNILQNNSKYLWLSGEVDDNLIHWNVFISILEQRDWFHTDTDYTSGLYFTCEAFQIPE